jgi:sugar phosphate permease
VLARPPPTPATQGSPHAGFRIKNATVSGLFDSASKFGGAIAMPLIVWMIYTFDWRLTFLIIGSVGILWVIAWYFIYAENPKNTNASVLQKCVLFAMAKNNITATKLYCP